MVKLNTAKYGRARYSGYGLALLSFAASASLVAGAALAQPLLLPGDPGLRADLRVLADAGLISQPLSVWPLPAAALAAELSASPPPQTWRPYLHDAWARARAALAPAARFEFSVALSDEPEPLRRYTATPRSRGLRLGWQDQFGPLTLNLRVAADSDHGDREELDGSYAGIRLNNWLVTAGALPRWWGPGHDASLILSHNARPVPALALDSLQPLRFDKRGLRWLGSMHFTAFAGRLEDNRAIAGARLLGARLTLRPRPGLEIGLSRSAQWGGQGRPEDLDSLLNLLLGRDNRGDAGITLADEPGNQLGGFDLRWVPLRTRPVALYTQWIGEDEAGGLPSRYIALAGAEVWHAIRGGYLRWYVEGADTSIEFYKDRARYNLAYEHFIYRSGYRFRGRSLGHAMDNDGRSFSIGVLRHGSGYDWEMLLRRVELNRDGSGARHSLAPQGEERWQAQFSIRHRLWGGHFDWGLSVDHVDPLRAPTRSRLHGFADWTRRW